MVGSGMPDAKASTAQYTPVEVSKSPCVLGES